MNIVKYSERVHMARTHELASASPPYERVPNILRFSYNNLFIVYPLISNGGILMRIPGISRPGQPFFLPQFMKK